MCVEYKYNFVERVVNNMVEVECAACHDISLEHDVVVIVQHSTYHATKHNLMKLMKESETT